MTANFEQADVVAEILRRKPMHRRFLKQALANLTDSERNDAETYVRFLTSEGASLQSLVDAYLLIVDDTFREELRFRETGKYRFSTFSETRNAVYDRPEYMHGYMIGLALSSYWWLNHVYMRRFFKQHLPALATIGGHYREIGPGHGIYFLDALRQGGFDSYEGVDVSATSVELTNRIISSGFFGQVPPATVRQSDFLALDTDHLADVLVMGEVLEHVEDPGRFLRRAHETTTAEGRVFLTTCINAPAIDHLYNPESIENLEALFSSHGFQVMDKCAFGRDGRSIEVCERERNSVNVSYVLCKSANTGHAN